MAALLAVLLALPSPAPAQSRRPAGTAGASTAPTGGTGSGVVLPGHPRLAADRSAVILLDEIREPADRRQPALILGIEPARKIPFVRIRAQGLVPPPMIFIRCGETTQPLPLTTSSREAAGTTGTYEVPPEFATTRLAPGSCYIALAGALVAVPYEMTLAVWGQSTAAGPGRASTGRTPALEPRIACVGRPPDMPPVPVRPSPRARPAAVKVVEMLGELSRWANGPASKTREDYLARLAGLETAAREFSAVAGADDAFARVVDAALGCFREAARSWPAVNEPWRIADWHVRAVERSLGPPPVAERAEAARPGERERQQAQGEVNRGAGERRPTATAEQAVAASPGGTPARATPVLAPVAFNGSEYIFRSAKDGLYEFTPRGEEDLGAWTSMLSIVVYENARTGDDLADIANRVLESYGARGRVLRTDSRPRTRAREAEHFAAAVLGSPTLLEAVFARFLVVEQTGVAVIFSRRIYGRRVGDEMSAWLAKHGPPTEQALMSWTGVPALAALRALPQAK